MKVLFTILYILYVFLAILLIFMGVGRVLHAIDAHNNLEFIWGLVLIGFGTIGLATRG